MTIDYNDAPISVRALSELTGIPRETITSALTEQGITLGRGARASVPLGRALRALLGARGKIDPSLLSPRERDLHFAAELKRQEFMKRQNQLLPRAEVAESTTRAFFALREVLLNMPDRIERQFAFGPDVLDAVIPWFDEAVVELGEAIDKCHRERPLILG